MSRRGALLWLITCGLLALLWVRSHYWRDNLELKIGTLRGFALESAVGQFGVFTYPTHDDWFDDRPIVGWFQVPTEADPCHPADNQIGFSLRFGSSYGRIVVPHWLLVLVTATITIVYGVRCGWRFRFSLRTLLLLTTATAIVLGLVAVFL
jgi:hypothetical protein